LFPHDCRPQPEDSIAGVVDKAVLLQVLDEITDAATEKQKALEVAHDEDISAWVEAIAQ
jgi:hypothetical protein